MFWRDPLWELELRRERDEEYIYFDDEPDFSDEDIERAEDIIDSWIAYIKGE